MIDWKSIQNYQGCQNFEQLQEYLNTIYKVHLELQQISPSQMDFLAQHPVTLSKCLHLHQLATQYYQFSNQELDRCLITMQDDITQLDTQIVNQEKVLLKSQKYLKESSLKLKRELKQRDIFMKHIEQSRLIQCLFCDKVSKDESQFDYHMKKYHRSDLNKKEVNTVYKAMNNLMLQQQLNLQLQSQQQKNQIIQQYNFLQKTKQELATETTGFINNTHNVSMKLAKTDSDYKQELQLYKEQIQCQLDIIAINQASEDQLKHDLIKQKLLELEQSLKLQDSGPKQRHSLRRQNTIKQLQVEKPVEQILIPTDRDEDDEQQNTIKQLQVEKPVEQILIPTDRDDDDEQRQVREYKYKGSHEQSDSQESMDEIDLYMRNQEQFIQKQDEYQHEILELLMNKNNGIHLPYTKQQYGFIKNQLEQAIAVKLGTYMKKDVKQLRILHEELAIETKIITQQIQTNVLGITPDRRLNTATDEEVAVVPPQQSVLISHVRTPSNASSQRQFQQ